MPRLDVARVLVRGPDRVLVPRAPPTKLRCFVLWIIPVLRELLSATHGTQIVMARYEVVLVARGPYWELGE